MAAPARGFTRDQRTTIVYGILGFVVVLVILQLWLLTATMNAFLGAFNLLPAFPMDGGRVFRSIVWGITRRYGRATLIAATMGQVFGVLLIALGVVRIVILGDVAGGVWTLVLGGFLVQSASAARNELRTTPGDVTGPTLTTATP